MKNRQVVISSEAIGGRGKEEENILGREEEARRSWGRGTPDVIGKEQ